MPLKIYFANFKPDAKFLLHLLLGKTKLFDSTNFFQNKRLPNRKSFNLPMAGVEPARGLNLTRF